MTLSAVFLVILILGLIYLTLSANIGARTVLRQAVIEAPMERVWAIVYPLGAEFGWNGAARQVHADPDGSGGRIITGHTGRDGLPIERSFRLHDVVEGSAYAMRYVDDSSLDQSFWANHSQAVALEEAGPGRTRVVMRETDTYRGVAFLIFRYFALRRMLIKLNTYATKGTFKPGGLFEHPLMQAVFAVVSTLLLWPIFGLNAHGFFLAATLTLVVAMHELGHMAAFRVMGHSSARMIFIPLLGGIALGGRPYDRHFEVGFAALMGAGFSTFAVIIAIAAHQSMITVLDPVSQSRIVLFALITAMFNLANLVPIWKFDGGQVLRQLFRSKVALAMGSAVVLAWFVVIGVLAGLSLQVMIGICTIVLLLSVMTAKSGVKPKSPLVAMNYSEKMALLAAFAAVFTIHGTAIIWSTRQLFG